MDPKGLIAIGIIVIIIVAYSFLMGRIYALVERIHKDVEKIKKSLPPAKDEHVGTEMKKRCSIMWCPWRAKYQFISDKYGGYYECWFHGGDILWLQFLWDIAWIPIRYFYCSLRYGINVYGGIINWYKLTWEDFIELRKHIKQASIALSILKVCSVG